MTSKMPAQQQLTPIEKPDISMLFPFGPSESISTNGDLLHSLESSSSLSSLGNMEGGYSSDAAEPPFYYQKKYSQNIHNKPPRTGLAPRKEAGEIYVNNELSVLDDFTLLSPDDNYEVLSSSVGNGVLSMLKKIIQMTLICFKVIKRTSFSFPSNANNNGSNKWNKTKIMLLHLCIQS